MMVYIVVLNNGVPAYYSDYYEWNDAVFDTKEKAVQYIDDYIMENHKCLPLGNIEQEYGYRIEEWEVEL